MGKRESHRRSKTPICRALGATIVSLRLTTPSSHTLADRGPTLEASFRLNFWYRPTNMSFASFQEPTFADLVDGSAKKSWRPQLLKPHQKSSSQTKMSPTCPEPSNKKDICFVYTLSPNRIVLRTIHAFLPNSFGC